jgi:DNA-binding ferritin-like protein
MKLGTDIHDLMEYHQQIKILHWQTEGYARHKAFDSAYEELGDLIDKFAEVAMGKYGRFVLENNDKSLKLKNLSEIHIIDFLQEIKHFLIGLTDEYDQRKDSDLLNIRDEMLGEINQLVYLLTLK